ncbi:SDR family NAD(P)-dependent oxidoreductase [Methylocystis parvus]|uniref:SDR family oxidoreductase n=1 Tax=Methylocystis parvus TaxID=134 RepID=A0A6B8LYH1_9HYPH|nr:SDR family NAD(P)-dependent oxidoreductase [Methylocystis parvus]QGM97437.1 SDR family oxidoreductase [Methylocystis parvus]WBJ98645.1 SDR family oxidoreductase [Methylocystis parvus OBBP]
MRNVIVTGASRGLGLAIARRLAADGFRVIAVARKESDGLKAAIAAAPEGVVFSACDLSDVEALAPFIAGLKKQFGAPYGLVNNAGQSVEGLLANTHNVQIESLLRINLTSPIVLTKHVARQMMAAGKGGRIVNISSIIASTGYNGLSVYGASKSALVGFTKSLSRELGQLDITVNAVAPGFIMTELTASLPEDDVAKIAGRAALRRLAEPDDVSVAVSFLLSDAARNMTGTVIAVDAGASA